MPTRILICGDGNFSFSLSVARLLKSGNEELVRSLVGRDGPFEVLCTSFDLREQLVKKYKECEHILPMLDGMGKVGVQVQHGINAWELETHYPGRQFDVVLWNHPHLGTENFNLHRFLMCHFMHSAKQVLADDGAVVLSVLEGQSLRWAITEQAERVGLAFERKAPFHPADYPGYETRRNRTGGSFQNTHTQHHTGDQLLSVTLRFRKNAAFVASPADPEAIPAPHEIKKKPAENKFFCKLCGKGFKKEQGLFTHNKQVHEYKKYGENWKAEGQSLPCPTCQRKFPNDDALWQHQIATHTEDVSIPHPSRAGDVRVAPDDEPEAKHYGYYPCEVCGMSVSRHPDWGMEAHLESLKPVVGLELRCGVGSCTKVFIEQRALRQHRNFCRVRQRGEEEGAARTAAAVQLLCRGAAAAAAAAAALGAAVLLQRRRA